MTKDKDNKDEGAENEPEVKPAERMTKAEKKQ